MPALRVLYPSVDFQARSVFDFTVDPPRPKAPRFVAMAWLGDPLVQTSPCFFVTEALALDLQLSGATGFTLTDIELEVDEQFAEFEPDTAGALPKFVELRPHLDRSADVFLTASLGELVVSEPVFDLLLKHGLAFCGIEDYIEVE